MTDDRTIALPGGYRFEFDEFFGDESYSLRYTSKNGVEQTIAEDVDASEARAFAAALASVSPSRDGDDGLAELSRKATQGIWSLEDRAYSSNLIWSEEKNCFVAEMIGDSAEGQEHNPELIVALVNAYRAGQLVLARQDGAAGQPVTLTYTNWRGETAERTITPTGRVLFMSNECHPKPQWLVEAHDARSGEVRLFALTGLHGNVHSSLFDMSLTEAAVGLASSLRSDGDEGWRFYQRFAENDPEAVAQARAFQGVLDPESVRQDGSAGQGVSGPGAVDLVCERPWGEFDAEDGLARTIPEQIMAEFEREARNHGNLWAPGVEAARQAFQVAVCKAWIGGIQSAGCMLAAAPTPAATPSGPAADLFWCLENAAGQWLRDENGAFTINVHLALRWPSFALADEARRNLRHPLYGLKVTEHKIVDQASGPAAVAVEEVERIELSNQGWAMRDGSGWLISKPMQDRSVWLSDDDLEAIRRLASPQDHGAVREAALEEAAKVAEKDRRSDLAKDCGYIPEWQKSYIRVAAEIRALKTNTDKPGREGEGPGRVLRDPPYADRDERYSGMTPSERAASSDAPRQDGEPGAGR